MWSEWKASIGTHTQQDPIGLAGGLNLYGFAGGDPINFWDPFGLCEDANGNTLPNSQCRQVTAAEGEAIYDAAVASGNWTWTKATEDVDNNIGDCTDYVENAMQDAGWPSLRTANNRGTVRTKGTGLMWFHSGVTVYRRKIPIGNR